mmetsp:Transcript_36927/g.118364  ORF Transcript_36927/g.118364 Transcript_36927/m.118364 type:complete len:117 (-) Transcript_36927:145-495(-)
MVAMWSLSVLGRSVGRRGVVDGCREMSKYVSKTKAKYLPLHAKHAKKGYYKGNGCRSTGRLTSKGRFIKDPAKLLDFVVPDLRGFQLKPYVAKTVDHVQFPLPSNLLATTTAGATK